MEKEKTWMIQKCLAGRLGPQERGGGGGGGRGGGTTQKMSSEASERHANLSKEVQSLECRKYAKKQSKKKKVEEHGNKLVLVLVGGYFSLRKHSQEQTER